jgi:inner membrane protein
VAAVVPILIFPLAMASMRIIPVESVISLALVGVPFALLARQASPRTRSAVALAAAVSIIAGFTSTSRTARRATLAALQPEIRGEVLDIVLTPNPSSPLCWAVIGVELRESRGEYVLWPGTLSLAPRWKPPTSCASHRFAGPSQARIVGEGALALTDEIHQPLDRLRYLAESDCWVRAWLQFGRAPVIAGGQMFDLRFGQRVGQNFTHMALKPGGGRPECPPNLASWPMPRADLLNPQTRRGLRP